MKAKIFVLIIVAFSHVLSAQEFEIYGYVSLQETGHPIPAHKVIVYNPVSDEYFDTQTNESGFYLFEFGDGDVLIDSLIVKTYSYCSESDQKEYSKTIHISDENLPANFEICKANMSECFAGFSHYSGRNKRVNFYGYSQGNYSWDFGDGTKSVVPEPEHYYAQDGRYKVALTIKNSNCSQTFFQTITVTTRFSVEGEVEAGENMLDNGRLFLFDNKTKGISTIFNEKNIAEGRFYFSDIDRGDYILFALPEHSFYPHIFPRYLPTYYGGVISWEKAQKIECNQNISDIELSLISYEQPFYGKYSVSGTITARNLTNYKGFVVYLLNKDMQPMNYTIPDLETGRYYFTDLPSGTYYIKPERSGVASLVQEVVLNAATESESVVSFDLENESFNLHKQNPQAQEFDVTFEMRYKSIFLNIEEEHTSDFICELFDTNGRRVHRSYNSPGNISLDLSNISSGIYLFRMSSYTNEKIYFKKIFISN